MIETVCAVWVTLPDYSWESLTPKTLDDNPFRALAGLARQQAADGSALIGREDTYRHIARALIWRLGKERAWVSR